MRSLHLGLDSAALPEKTVRNNDQIERLKKLEKLTETAKVIWTKFRELRNCQFENTTPAELLFHRIIYRWLQGQMEKMQFKISLSRN